MKNTLFAALLFALAVPRALATSAVSTITPAADVTSGGTYVHIHGEGLGPAVLLCPLPSCFLYVTFGGETAKVISATADEIVALAPPHAAGLVDVVVNVPGSPTMTIPNGFRYVAPLDSDNVRVLLPLVINTTGALGSTWRSDVTVTNGNAQSVTLHGGALTHDSMTVAAHGSAPLALAPVAGATGMWAYVPRAQANGVTIATRVHDTSRDADSWGVDIPAVPETQFRDTITLSGVPADPRFRTTLRVYGYQSSGGRVFVEMQDEATGEPLAGPQIDVAAIVDQAGVAIPSVPPYAQLALDSLIPPGHPRVRVTLTQGGNWIPMPMWAFVSVTNNATQQVTTVTPSIRTPVTAATR